MSFQHDVEETPGLSDACRRGIQALDATDREKITARPSRKLAGSVYLDSQLADRFPDANRWDYVVAWDTARNEELLHWIEVHPAGRRGCVDEVLAKLTWLKEWLNAEGTRLKAYRRKIVWIASGRSAFQQNSPQLRKLVARGVYFAGGHYVMAD